MNAIALAAWKDVCYCSRQLDLLLYEYQIEQYLKAP